ncbi:MAG: universal stress protein [Sphingomonas bacterium]
MAGCPLRFRGVNAGMCAGPGGRMKLFHRIVHANDGSENSLAALSTALDLAGAAQSTLDIILVEEISPHSAPTGEVATRMALEQHQIQQRRLLVERIVERKSVPAEIHAFVGHPVDHIVEFVLDHNADLLVIGATEHADLWERLFGRRSDRMTHKVNCSVLIVRAQGHGAA